MSVAQKTKDDKIESGVKIRIFQLNSIFVIISFIMKGVVMFLFVYRKSKWNHLYISILTCFFFMGCVSFDNNSNIITKVENLTGYYMTNEVTPENEHKFKKVPFEKAVNPSFQKNLRGKLRFVAIYKGTVPDAKIRSSNHLTLKLCDPVRTDVCSEKIIMPEKKATDIFNFENNQLFDVFGIVSESSGMKIGGANIAHSQVGGLGAITFFKVWAMKPINSDEGNLNTSNLNKSKIIQKNSKNTFETPNIRLIQTKLIKLGYNPGPVDGLIGSKTRKAIIRFQKDVKIKVTGIADSNTLIAMGLREGIVEYTSKKGSEKTESEKIKAVPAKSEEIEKNVQLKQPALVKVVEEKTVIGKGKLIETTSLLSEPRFMAAVIKKISVGQIVELLGKKDSFYKIRYQDMEGYIYDKFVAQL